ncbi:Exodeoxyribonuclease 8 [Nocardia cerradoensis]|uniref:Exodeoxyribonuclease 8 n=1 Tax=Nocardia cerradoensis TaxID=85688 RepID=A0A231HCK3_9NOCA|nr:PD-(D/E)XK nuclease-like domain-containing protein [Nocardia cerradoensis]OXR46631.1 Exodeoxyribonuclease 8 [Nocardia cerradoensis]
MTNAICWVTDLDEEVCPHCHPEPVKAAPPTEPDLYPDIAEEVYHGDTSALSQSGAKALLKTVPAQWIYDWLHPEPVEVNEIMEFGSAVHSLTLGVGAKVVEIKAENWTRKADQQIRKEHRAAGEIPLLTAKYRRAVAMADAVRLHPVIGPRLEDSQRELSGWFRDPETGIMRRFRIDALHTTPAGAALAMDVKTAETADPNEFAKSIRKFGYDQQDDWYVEGLEELGVPGAAFLFVVVGRKPPHLVSLNTVPRAYVERGRERNRDAIRLYAECLAAGHWPDYGVDTIHEIEQPAWAYRED